LANRHESFWIENTFTGNNTNTAGWRKIKLDSTAIIPRKGNDIQPPRHLQSINDLVSASFEMKGTVNAKNATWRMLINASGNGYIYLNGHNLRRYGEAGLQREFYLPECWLRFGPGKKNVMAWGSLKLT